MSAIEYMSKSDVVTSALRELIITGEFPAESSLRQRELAARFGVSPTPVREALRRLEAEGLVDYDVHRGATVIEARLGPSEENFQIRAVLEALAARLAAERISEDDLTELQSLHDAMVTCAQDSPEMRDLNRSFHFRIYAAARSPMLLALLRLLWQSFPDGPQVTRPHDESVSQHAGIIQALRDGDADAAEQLTYAHILGAAKDLDAGA